MNRTSHARRLYVVEPSPEWHHPGKQSAGGAEPQPDDSTDEHEPAQSKSDIADLDARLAGMSVLLRLMLRAMKS